MTFLFVVFANVTNVLCFTVLSGVFLVCVFVVVSASIYYNAHFVPFSLLKAVSMFIFIN